MTEFEATTDCHRNTGPGEKAAESTKASAIIDDEATERWNSDFGCQSSIETEDPGVAGGSYDVVILTNGPGEVAAWVKPVVRALRKKFGVNRSRLRLSVVLSPCPHASQQEAALVRSFPEVDRCQEAQDFSSLLLWGRTAENWDWRRCGVCLFLGGDQFNALALGWRLGYRTVLYAEESARWTWLADMYVLRNASLLKGVPSFARSRCTVVGDLFTDAVAMYRNETSKVCKSASELGALQALESPSMSVRCRQILDSPISTVLSTGSSNGTASLELGSAAVREQGSTVEEEDRLQSHAKAGPLQGSRGPLTVGILPGSKPVKLGLGVPYFLAAVDHIHSESPDVRFLLPLAPTVSLDQLAAQASPSTNYNIQRFGWASASMERLEASANPRFDPDPCGAPVAILTTPRGARVEVFQHFPAYDVFRECDVCITTVGTNTAELGSLAIPMVVALPTHSLEVFRGATGGIGGLLANLPGRVGDVAARAVNATLLRTAGFVSWPNRWASEAIVPELIGRVEPEEVAAVVLDFLHQPIKLQRMHERLVFVNENMTGQPKDGKGAAERIAQAVENLLLTR